MKWIWVTEKLWLVMFTTDACIRASYLFLLIRQSAILETTEIQALSKM